MAKLVGRNALICGDSRTLNVSVAFDITGYTVFFTVKPQDDTATDDSTALIQKTVTSHIDAVNGETSIVLGSADTRIAPSTYSYDIQFKDATGDISSSGKQDIEFTEDVTKRTS